jgi:hypothetical protein
LTSTTPRSSDDIDTAPRGIPVVAATDAAPATADASPPAASISQIPAPPVLGPQVATPEPAGDEPSDGVVRAIAAADTAPLARRRPSEPPPNQDDLPKEATGEIVQRMRTTAEPETSQPSILVADMAAVHAAVSAASSAPPPKPITPNDAASSSKELSVSDLRRDAIVAFTDAEEAFFSAGHDRPTKPHVSTESFDDLDEGYQPLGFWDRVFGRRRSTKKRR